MPQAAKRPCPRCRTLIPAGKGCPTCAPVVQRSKDTKTPEERRFYSSAEWQRIRRAQLQREPLCRECLARDVVKPATVADHIKPRRLGGSNDPENLQSLCWTDHQKKRQQERGA